MACKTLFISASLLSHPDPLSIRGSRSLVGGFAETGRETERLAIKSTVETTRRCRNVCMRRTPRQESLSTFLKYMIRDHIVDRYLACTKKAFERAVPPPATTSMNDMPGRTSGTVASTVVSFTNL